MKTTGWIDGRIKPLASRPGLYRRKFGERRVWSWWNGKHWKAWSTSARRAASIGWPSDYQDLPWCGLAKPPMGTGFL